MCAHCSGTVQQIAKEGIQLYRLCTGCGPGWFDYLSNPIAMIENGDDFISEYVDVHDVEVHIATEGVAVVFYGDESNPAVVAYPFTWEEFRQILSAGFEGLRVKEGGDA